MAGVACTGSPSDVPSARLWLFKRDYADFSTLHHIRYARLERRFAIVLASLEGSKLWRLSPGGHLVETVNIVRERQYQSDLKRDRLHRTQLIILAGLRILLYIDIGLISDDSKVIYALREAELLISDTYIPNISWTQLQAPTLAILPTVWFAGPQLATSTSPAMSECPLGSFGS